MRKIFAFLFLFISILLFAQLAFAQSATSSAVNLIFPIAELGNCSSAQDCKTYCDDPTHIDACVAYAKEKGFYKTSPLDENQQAILSDAEATFGCNSLSSCREYCQDTSHQAACSAFAQKHNLKGGKQNTTSAILEKAKTVLGCTSVDSCKTFCSQEENKDTCAAFAKENGLKGGNQTVGPGGCTSENSCKTFCSNPDNFSTCSSFMQSKVGSGSGQKQFTGPGGCTSEESCKSFCSKNLTTCHLNPAGHEAAMSATAAAHLQINMQKKDDCQEHPEKCRPTSSSSAGFRQETQNNSQQPHQPSGQNGEQQLPIQQTGVTQNRNEDGGSNSQGGKLPVRPTLSVEGVSTQRSFWDLLISKIFTLK